MGVTINVDDSTRGASVTAGIPVDATASAGTRGLSAVASTVGPAVRIVTPDDPAWAAPTVGATFVSDGCGSLETFVDNCVDPTVPAVFDGLLDSQPGTRVTVRSGASCQPPATAGELLAAATRRVDDGLWSAVANRMWVGPDTPEPGNQYFTDGSAVDVGAGDTLGVADAVAALANFAWQCQVGGERVLHVPVGLLDVMQARGVIVAGEAPGRWRTASGMLVVGDPGYPNAGWPTVPVFVTGPVYAAVSDTVITASDAPALNRHLVVGARVVEYAWFCCLLTATVNVCA